MYLVCCPKEIYHEAIFLGKLMKSLNDKKDLCRVLIDIEDACNRISRDLM